MKRRDFLRAGGAVAASLALSGYVSAQVSARKQKVIVMGAGLAGLVAAYELDKAGFEVKVLEAQARSGGRVLTVREFSEGLHAEAGAARIPHGHDVTLKYVSEFGLELAPFYPTENKFMRMYDGRAEEIGWDKFAEATSFVMSLGKPDRWQKIKGGNDLLPSAFANKLGAKVRYRVPVVKIERRGEKVDVSFQETGKVQTEECDRLVCAIPFSMLTKVEVAPDFSAEKQEAIRKARYDSASRLFIETKRRFWLDRRLNGFAFGDDFAEIWDSTFGQPGTHGILQRYLRGGGSADLVGKPEAVRAEESLAKLNKFFPEIRANFVKSYSKCWNEDPWVMGAWAHLDNKLRNAGLAPEGRVHFAGEHLSGNTSWMQGALQSGLRAASEILSAPAAISSTL